MVQRRVVVCADHLLVGESVGAALSSVGLRTQRVEAWPVAAGEVPADIDVGVLLSDLEPDARLEEARALLRATAVPWVVLAGAAPAPAWGGALEAGAGGVLPSTVGLERLCDAIERVADGGRVMDQDDERALIDAWRVVGLGRCLVIGRMRSLTPRELAVLRELHAGVAVARIAERSGVARATVRSQVRAILHKLGVRTQLAAVAVYDTVKDDVSGPTHTRDAC